MTGEPDWDQLDCEPWEQLPKESAKSFAMFVAYRDLDPIDRSIRGVARQLGKSVAAVGRLSSTWWWHTRCRLWDQHVDRITQARLVDLRTQRSEMQQRLAAEALQKVAQRLLGDESAGIEAFDVNTLTASELIRWLDVATRVERTALGEPDQKVELTGADGGPIEVETETETNPEVAAALALVMETARQPAPDNKPAKKTKKKAAAKR